MTSDSLRLARADVAARLAAARADVAAVVARIDAARAAGDRATAVSLRADRRAAEDVVASLAAEDGRLGAAFWAARRAE